MVLKLGTQFGADFEAYKNLEDGQSKSEAGFMAYLAHQGAGKEGVGEINRRFRSYLYSSVLESHDNAMSQYVSASNRSSMEKPLTIDMLSKSLFSCFLHREPTSDNMAMDAYMRDAEMSNVVALMNMLHECALREMESEAPSGRPEAGEVEPNLRYQIYDGVVRTVA